MQLFAQELVRLNPDVLVGITTPATAALQAETKTVPIVFAMVSDPIGSGFVASFAKPGGNITGFVNIEASLSGKWLELMHRDRTVRVACRSAVQSADRTVRSILFGYLPMPLPLRFSVRRSRRHFTAWRKLKQ